VFLPNAAVVGSSNPLSNAAMTSSAYFYDYRNRYRKIANYTSDNTVQSVFFDKNLQMQQNLMSK
jgi:rRNA maturation endonuclease Nob1